MYALTVVRGPQGWAMGCRPAALAAAPAHDRIPRLALHAQATASRQLAAFLLGVPPEHADHLAATREGQRSAYVVQRVQALHARLAGRNVLLDVRRGGSSLASTAAVGAGGIDDAAWEALNVSEPDVTQEGVAPLQPAPTLSS